MRKTIYTGKATAGPIIARANERFILKYRFINPDGSAIAMAGATMRLVIFKSFGRFDIAEDAILSLNASLTGNTFAWDTVLNIQGEYRYAAILTDTKSDEYVYRQGLFSVGYLPSMETNYEETITVYQENVIEAKVDSVVLGDGDGAFDFEYFQTQLHNLYQA